MSSTQPASRFANGVVPPYDFSMGDVFKEAWQKTSGFKATLWGALLIYFGAYFLLSILGHYTHPGVISLISTFVLYPITIGLRLLGVRRAANLPVQASLVLSYYPYILRLAGVLITISLIFIVIGIVGSIIPYVLIYLIAKMGANLDVVKLAVLILWVVPLLLFVIYLYISYLFAAQLCIEKNLGVFAAIRASYRGVTQRWFLVFFTYIVITLVVLISALPLFIGLIWSIPWGITAQGIVYRTIYGVEGTTK